MMRDNALPRNIKVLGVIIQPMHSCYHFINYLYFSLMFDDQIKQSHLKNEMAYGGISMSAMLKYGGV